MHEQALRQPPHSIEAEQALLGAVMLDPDAAHDTSLPAEMFYRREHRVIWTAVQALAGRNTKPDTIAVSEYLRDCQKLSDAGGIEYLADLTVNATAPQHSKAYAQIVRERAAERQMIQAAHRIADMGYNPDGRTLADRALEAQAMLAGLDQDTSNAGPQQLDAYLKAALEEMEAQHQNKGQLMGLSTGFKDLDTRTQGLRPDQLIIVAGRPGMGKSVLAANIAEHVSQQGQLVVFFSLEMPGIELGYRTLASQSRVSSQAIRSANLDPSQWDRLISASAKLKGRPFWVDEDPGVTSAQIAARAQEVGKRAGMPVSLVVVDYLQLLGDKGDGVGRVSTISRNLKLAAKAMHCPVIALSQLSRGVEARADKRPLMSDLRESGAIEADADIIWMVYRDEVYNENSQQKGIAEIITRKARSGKIGTDFLADNLQFFRFDNLQFGGAA